MPSDRDVNSINTFSAMPSNTNIQSPINDSQIETLSRTPTQIFVQPGINISSKMDSEEADISHMNFRDITSSPHTTTNSENLDKDYDPETEKVNFSIGEPEQPSNIPPPDKGYAWAILAGGLMIFILSFGSFNAFGVFQTYYLLDIFKDESAESIAWISTLTVVMTLTGGLFSGIISRTLGVRNACIAASLFGTLSLILSSFFKKIWHLVLTQGIMYGFASSILINLALTMQILWFEKHKGFALSLISAGGGIGSLILVPTVTATVNQYGIKWSFRILAGIYLITTGVGSLLMRPRFPFKMTKKIIDPTMLKDPFLLFNGAAGFVMNIGYCVPLLYFPASLESIGKSVSFSTYFIMVYAGISIVGRVSSGYLSDKIGSLKILIFCHAITTVAIFTLWYKRSSFGFFAAFYVIFGLFGINYFSLSPNIMGRHFSNEKVGLANATLFLLNGISSLIAIPTLGLIFQKVGHRASFDVLIIIGGTFYGLSCLIFIAFRIYLTRFTEKYKNAII
ncbi:hypothetical protein BB560_002158 [Smittium megazygosporum]|uniref:Major facilitator superfamily (MFS) profile domain-containing protein n=1 Tax=Smittium megazygosporum TaxID=133381 RepID=A0A2T9ZFM2_9FUNG|nr:hypothetical protein BB560_002158 [Smittium megazygosporum]